MKINFKSKKVWGVLLGAILTVAGVANSGMVAPVLVGVACSVVECEE